MRSRDFWILIGIGLVAFVMRFLAVRASGGLHALLGYDEGVYFGGATAMVDGLMPYRDFVLVHPPGLLLLLSPFAKIGALTSDSTGWALARLFIMLLGSVNAVLVYVVARRVSLTAAIVAGGLYALWTPAIHVERTTMLESVVLLALLVALVALPKPRVGIVSAVVAGTFLGLGTSVKLWGLVPLVVIIAWLLISRAWRTSAIVSASAAAVLVAAVAPFAAIAPQRMWDLIILGQLQRGGGGTGRAGRVVRMFNVDISAITHHHVLGAVATVVVLAITGFAIVLAWRGAVQARLWVVLLLVQGTVLMVVPVYFDGYSSFVAPALLLILGTATSIALAYAADASRTPRLILRAAVLALVIGASLMGIYRSAIHGAVNPTSPSAIAAAAVIVAPKHCVAADSPGLLLLTNTLSRNISRGCNVLIDVDGTIYGIAHGRNPQRLDSIPRRLASAEYQQILNDYFLQADATIIHRLGSDGLTVESLAALHQRPLILNRRDLTVFGR